MEASVAIYRFSPPREPLRHGAARRGAARVARQNVPLGNSIRKRGHRRRSLAASGCGSRQKGVSFREAAFHRALPAQSEEIAAL